MRNKALWTSTFVGLVIASVTLAGNVTLPHVFQAHTVASATEVNANFVAVKTAVDDNHARISMLEARTNEPWINVVAFNTGWSNYGGTGFRTAQYMKDVNGVVHLRGLVKRTSGSAPLIFTLPSGYVPSAYVFFVQQATSAYGDIQINWTGSSIPGGVQLGTGTASYVSLDGIHFDTR